MRALLLLSLLSLAAAPVSAQDAAPKAGLVLQGEPAVAAEIDGPIRAALSVWGFDVIAPGQLDAARAFVVPGPTLDDASAAQLRSALSARALIWIELRRAGSDVRFGLHWVEEGGARADYGAAPAGELGLTIVGRLRALSGAPGPAAPPPVVPPQVPPQVPANAPAPTEATVAPPAEEPADPPPAVTPVSGAEPAAAVESSSVASTEPAEDTTEPVEPTPPPAPDPLVRLRVLILANAGIDLVGYGVSVALEVPLVSLIEGTNDALVLGGELGVGFGYSALDWQHSLLAFQVPAIGYASWRIGLGPVEIAPRIGAAAVFRVGEVAGPQVRGSQVDLHGAFVGGMRFGIDLGGAQLIASGDVVVGSWTSALVSVGVAL